jgi:glycosyltransferase involved in cell wall biosynthesis
MAVKLVLTQIMKNESHVAKRMLDSIKPIVDALCIVDTGSTDNSIEVVKQWGKDNGVETFVFEKAFDNFESCRNHAFEMARAEFLTRGDGHDWYSFWLDFDEQIVVDSSFDKQFLERRPTTYTRPEFVPYTQSSQPFIEPDLPYAPPEKIDPVIVNKKHIDKSVDF